MSIGCQRKCFGVEELGGGAHKPSEERSISLKVQQDTLRRIQFPRSLVEWLFVVSSIISTILGGNRGKMLKVIKILKGTVF